MKNYNEEYFFLSWDGLAKHPLLTEAEDQSESVLLEEVAISPEEFPFMLEFMEPKPKKAEMVDYHSYSTSHVINEKLKKILEDYNLPNVQFIPAEITTSKGERYDDYYIIHIYNLIQCVNKEESTFTTFEDGSVKELNNLVLNNKLLDTIPLGERLVFAIGEQSILSLFHISVVEKLLKAGAEGMTVYRVSKWNKYAPQEEEISKFFLG